MDEASLLKLLPEPGLPAEHAAGKRRREALLKHQHLAVSELRPLHELLQPLVAEVVARPTKQGRAEGQCVQVVRERLEVEALWDAWLVPKLLQAHVPQSSFPRRRLGAADAAGGLAAVYPSRQRVPKVLCRRLDRRLDGRGLGGSNGAQRLQLAKDLLRHQGQLALIKAASGERLTLPVIDKRLLRVHGLQGGRKRHPGHLSHLRGDGRLRRGRQVPPGTARLQTLELLPPPPQPLVDLLRRDVQPGVLRDVCDEDEDVALKRRRRGHLVHGGGAGRLRRWWRGLLGVLRGVLLSIVAQVDVRLAEERGRQLWRSERAASRAARSTCATRARAVAGEHSDPKFLVELAARSLQRPAVSLPLRTAWEMVLAGKAHGHEPLPLGAKRIDHLRRPERGVQVVRCVWCTGVWREGTAPRTS